MDFPPVLREMVKFKFEPTATLPPELTVREAPPVNGPGGGGGVGPGGGGVVAGAKVKDLGDPESRTDLLLSL